MKERVPRQYSLVRLTDQVTTWSTENGHRNSPLLQDAVFVYLGEIPNMEGHCVVVRHKGGLILSGYHIDSFVEIPEDET